MYSQHFHKYLSVVFFLQVRIRPTFHVSQIKPVKPVAVKVGPGADGPPGTVQLIIPLHLSDMPETSRCQIVLCHRQDSPAFVSSVCSPSSVLDCFLVSLCNSRQVFFSYPLTYGVIDFCYGALCVRDFRFFFL